ncbi:MAG: hypothetical protein QMD85_03000 [Candidatus Aenigmarchaeota archaeon]|nr:hypothetical protein [Candidatus Aenigmarchaeota archaeon]MDI6722507.1 hypothetical protein [Candidatus Aenigmarchaeota archaeon]
MQTDRRQSAIDFTKEIKTSKHFRNTWLRKWDWDINDLRSALMQASIERTGKTKYEAFVKEKKGSRKIIFVYTGDDIFIITGAEGK